MKKFLCSKDAPIVQTAEGKLRGYKWGDMYHFNGIKYADSERFCMPTPVKPWEGIREAQMYGYCSSTLRPYPVDRNMIVPHRYWHDSEDCQYLNIWTTELGEKAKKPVMVWIHGGGYSNGSSLEHVDYDGENLARSGDVVVVSINHRLNIIGYLDLSSFDDEKFHNSGNVGNADIVAALQWIQNNIAAFGGDANNVTVFGQSGGGAKICDLLMTPSAEGLFHKAIIESGVIESGSRPRVGGREVALAMLAHLGLGEDDYMALTKLTYRELADCYNAVEESLYGFTGGFVWAPTPNDWLLGSVQDGMCAFAKKIPIIVGTVFGEFVDKFEDEPEKLSEAEQVEIVRKKFGEHADEILEVFRATYPEKPICYAAVVDNLFRPATIRFCDCVAAQSEVPLYSYMLTYCFEYMGTYPTWHCAELPLVFHNIDLIEVYGHEDCEKLQAEMSGAWVAFARTGNPNHAGMINWPPYEAKDEMTIVFDKETRVAAHHDKKLIETIVCCGAVQSLDKDEDENAAHPY